MRFLLFGILLILFSACQTIEDPPNIKAQVEHLIVSNTIRWLKENKGLYACGLGGREHAKIEMLAVSFDYYKSVDNIEQGRELLMSAIQRFIFEINKETRFQEYLYISPFPPEGVEVRIFIQTFNGDPLPPDQIIVLAFTRGILRYDITEENSNWHHTIHKETYAEALAKLKEAGKEFELEIAQ